MTGYYHNNLTLYIILEKAIIMQLKSQKRDAQYD